MTLCVEISRPWQWTPGRFTSRVMRRWWWGCVAIAVIRVPFDEFARTAYDWRNPAINH